MSDRLVISATKTNAVGLLCSSGVEDRIDIGQDSPRDRDSFCFRWNDPEGSDYRSAIWATREDMLGFLNACIQYVNDH